MDISYLYTQKRREFGKPCEFSAVGPHLLVDINPDEEFQKEFYIVTTMNRGVDNSIKFCAHEVNTVSYPTVSRGMKHIEGGWPSGVDVDDEDSTTRFKKKIEKDKNYINSVKFLGERIESMIMENNSIDIYEEYFDEEITGDGSISFSTLGALQDFNEPCRRVVDISWSADSTKVACAYSIVESKGTTNNICLDSYVWDLSSCGSPSATLKAEWWINCLEFNPTSVHLIAGGYSSGQVAIWDARASGYAQQLSAVQDSHSEKVTGIKWLESDTQTSIFSTSLDGKVMSWDIRKFASPTLVVNLGPSKDDTDDVEECYSISCFDYDPTVPKSFILGTEQGKILSFLKSNAENPQYVFDCESGPVLSMERNAFFPQLFASTDPWNVKIWTDFRSQSPVLTLKSGDGYYTDLSWSGSRASMIFLSKTNGELEVWDIPGNSRRPFSTVLLEKGLLCSVACNSKGDLVACGSASGLTYLLEIPKSLQQTTESDLNAVAKIIDAAEISGGRSRWERHKVRKELQDISSIGEKDTTKGIETEEVEGTSLSGGNKTSEVLETNVDTSSSGGKDTTNSLEAKEVEDTSLSGGKELSELLETIEEEDALSSGGEDTHDPLFTKEVEGTLLSEGKETSELLETNEGEDSSLPEENDTDKPPEDDTSTPGEKDTTEDLEATSDTRNVYMKKGEE